jgi:hypothetical protein
LKKYPEKKWDIIGSISTEDRCLGIFDKSISINKNTVRLFEIIDPPSKNTKVIQEKIALNKNKYLALGGLASEIETHQLMEQHHLIVSSIDNFLINTTGNIIFDITTFPKRFFFPILKKLIQKDLENLFVTYTTPDGYCKEDLSANPDTWSHIPLFGPVDFPEPTLDTAIVGVGFMPFGLSKLLLSKYNTVAIKFLFPFPPGPPNYQRTWEFVRGMEALPESKNINNALIRISANNMPDAYNYLIQETNNGEKKTIFAPYGPKPISLAMCLFAIKFEAPVFYTQPKYYTPDYSFGIKDCFCYPIVYNKKSLY